MFGQIQSKSTGDHLYSDPSPTVSVFAGKKYCFLEPGLGCSRRRLEIKSQNSGYLVKKNFTFICRKHLWNVWHQKDDIMGQLNQQNKILLLRLTSAVELSLYKQLQLLHVITKQFLNTIVDNGMIYFNKEPLLIGLALKTRPRW